MRNLKRALSLGLTAAMISGLMVMGSSAASYADVADTDNVEAIEVLQAVGIMVGDNNGEFNPDQNVTRNEMAVVMANLMEYNVASYRGTSPFTDVPSWAEPYVAACYTNGITAGTSATTYGGSETVTTAQAALMLMKALGYFQYAQDFGNDWQLATVRQGNDIYLFDGVDSGVQEAMTRNDVAQLVLNTLESGMVNPTTNGSITVGGVTIATDVKYNYITSNEGFAESISDATSTDANSDAKKSIVELGEHLYEGDLAKDGGHDAFGRPAAIWSYKDNEIGTYVDERTQTWTTKVTERDLYRAAGTAAVNDYAWTIWVDGDDVDTTAHGEGYELDRNDTERWMKTGNGVLTEMFVDTVNETVDVTIINTYVGQVTRVEPNEDNTDYAVTVSFETQPSGYVSRQFNTEDEFAMDDIVVMGIANGNIETMAVAETVEGSIAAVKDFDSVEIGGTKYNYNYGYTATAPGNLINAGLVDLDGNGIQNPDTGDDITLYLDTNGCVVAMADASSVAEDYLYVKGTHEEFGNVYAEVVYYDGSEEVIKIDEVDGKANNGEGSLAGNAFYDYDNGTVDHKVYLGVYQYSRSGNAYDLFSTNYNGFTANKSFDVAPLFTDSNDDGKIDDDGGTPPTITGNYGRIEKGHAVFGPYNGSNYVSGSGEELSTANDNTVYVDTVRNITYTGYRNVPTMTDVEGFVVVEGRGGIADIVFITNDVDYELDNDSFFYISDLNPRKTTDADGNTIWIYSVTREGEPTELTASSKLNNLAKGFFKIDKYDSHDYVTKVSPVVLEDDANPANADLLSKGTIAYAQEAEGNTLVLGSVAGDKALNGTTTTFSLNDETVYLTAYLSKDNTKVDRVALGSFNQIRSVKEYGSDDITGVYVLNATDKTNRAPTAKLVLIVSYTEYVDMGPYTVNVPAAPAGVTLTVKDQDGKNIASGTKVDRGTVLSIEAVAEAGYVADITINGTAQGKTSMTYTVNAPVSIGATATSVGDYAHDALVDISDPADVTIKYDSTNAKPTPDEAIQLIAEQVLAENPTMKYLGADGKSYPTLKVNFETAGGIPISYTLDYNADVTGVTLITIKVNGVNQLVDSTETIANVTGVASSPNNFVKLADGTFKSTDGLVSAGDDYGTEAYVTFNTANTIGTGAASFTTTYTADGESIVNGDKVKIDATIVATLTANANVNNGASVSTPFSVSADTSDTITYNGTQTSFADNTDTQTLTSNNITGSALVVAEDETFTVTFSAKPTLGSAYTVQAITVTAPAA